MKKDVTKFIGKTLKEVKKIYPDVRVAAAGNVQFALTCDWVENRLNVVLGKENLQFGSQTATIGNETIVFETVDEDTLDNGIVISAHFG